MKLMWRNKFTILTLFVTLPLFSFSQEKTNAEKNRIERSNYFFNYKLKGCSQAILYAKKDIKDNKLTLYSSSGMIPRSEKEGKKMIAFMKKYNLKYSNFGCVAPNYKCVTEYNKQIFDYLTETYGKKWMKEIDKYIIGFAEWKLAFDKK